MSTATITVPVNRLRRALVHAVSWSAHSPATGTGPADLDLPRALAEGLPIPAPRAPEVPPKAAAGRGSRPVAHPRTPAVRR